MIKYLSEDRCIQCNLCVKVCPTSVFDKVADHFPTISRQEDCQTCFLCEAYCPVDALYVSPMLDNTNEPLTVTPEESAMLGSYRQAIGWGKGRSSTASLDMTHILRDLVEDDAGPRS
ncbi:4Fe-4S ferredoxin [Cohnella sp. CIP 111063]|jgi:NAD-dependent dihydropyrimidine dehydrogenase PreA subunit|uniref:4Fe-4S dicluster domain-containing protein n=1 Tax=unclassified Cohnella TaxID=2636738 RepID=UPI000B8C145B|nr:MULTISPECIES: ferredoxin family protein [unclassified Cohnella]OXS53178.1 4Fe-4S ferredoxin [Cohnella sp. CIP 111063]PRX60941.1 4Fe-4S binding protein [Cohnella sp. SGD-V74]